MQLNSCVRALVSISYFRCIWLFNLGFEFRNIWNPSIGYNWMTANFFREASPNLRINNQPISTIGSFNETIEGRSHHGSNHMGCPKIGLPRNHQFGWDYMIIPDKPSSVFGHPLWARRVSKPQGAGAGAWRSKCCSTSWRSWYVSYPGFQVDTDHDRSIIVGLVYKQTSNCGARLCWISVGGFVYQ